MTAYSAPPVVSFDKVVRWRNRRRAKALEKNASTVELEELDSIEWKLRDVAKFLHLAYGTPNLGNRKDPTDEFVYIVLSRKTAERAYLPAFRALKKVASWERVLEMGEGRICSLIRGGGLEAKKATAIYKGLRTISNMFGRPNLTCANQLSDRALFDLLTSLPEVGPKSARCVMLYGFGRPTFPVDTHVGRVLARLGCFSLFYGNLSAMGHKARQRVLQDAVPPDIRYGLHVNSLVHGRTVCHARTPACDSCILKTCCSFVEFQ